MCKFLNLFKPKAPRFPEIEPYHTGRLDVGDGHQLYFEESGNPKGVPVVFCHGGPGSFTKPRHRRLFNPKKYRIILFDQRGCGQSTPAQCIENNTTQHLVADMEALRHHLNVDTWHVFGGSWGSTLALIYAQTHPTSVRSLMIYGVFTARQSEMQCLYSASGVAAHLYPEFFEVYQGFLPEVEQKDILASYIQRITTQKGKKRTDAALAFTAWEMNLLSIQPDAAEISEMLNPETFDGSYATINLHYFKNNCFLKESEIIKGMAKIKHIPLSIVQGRYDVVCPPKTAWDVYKAHGQAQLEICQMAGHSISDGEMTAAAVRMTNRHASL